MKHLTVGILAHVDAGKTTLTEAMMFLAGKIRDMGRVDAGSAHLDFDPVERARGISVYSAQTDIDAPGAHITIIDTPGHADLTPETERALWAMDCAVIVISGIDGPQAHTGTLWKLASRYDLPVFIFVSKMDMAREPRGDIMAALKARLSGACVDMAGGDADEEMALTDDAALAEYIANGSLLENTVAELIAGRKAFPCYFGSGLKLTGVDALISALSELTIAKPRPDEFGARVYKIARDARGARLTYIKLTGGALAPRDTVEYTDKKGETIIEKVQEIRTLSGGKYEQAKLAEAGGLYALTGLTGTFAGLGMGSEGGRDAPAALMEPAFRYRVRATDSTDKRALMEALNILGEEEPARAPEFDPATGECRVGLMGDIDAEVFMDALKRRFNIGAVLDEGRVLYRETVTDAVYGAGHFEPLRHYAELRVKLEPAPRGSGIAILSSADTDVFPMGYQAQAFSALRRKRHAGALTGAALTDVKMTIIAGRGHLKHTEGGDFYQAASRAVRQALMKAVESGRVALLEPYYEISLSVPVELSVKALSDILRMEGRAEPPEADGETAVIHAFAPARTVRGYARELAAYTRGMGRITLAPAGMEPVSDARDIIAASGYDAERDTVNPADSVFTDRGGSVTIPWREAERYMHTELPRDVQARARDEKPRAVSDEELEAIMLRAVGPVKRPLYSPARDGGPGRGSDIRLDTVDTVFVDGYNLIFAWEELKALAAEDLGAARLALLDILADYRAFRGTAMTVVFDAYRTGRGTDEAEKHRGLDVVYTKKDESADVYIAKTLSALGLGFRARVITSDNLIRLGALECGALMTGAVDFKLEVESVLKRISDMISERRSDGSANIGERNSAK